MTEPNSAATPQADESIQRQREGPIAASPPGLPWLAATVSGVAAAVFVLAVVLYAHTAPRFVPNLPGRVAEVAYKQGLRYEKGRQYEAAEQAYREALQGHFVADSDRTDALMRLGRILSWNPDPREALAFLEEARQRPEHTVWLYEPLVNSYLKLGKREEAVNAAAEWYTAAQNAKLPDQQALAKHAEGTAWLRQGDKDKALASFEAGCVLVGGGLNAYDAGLLLYERGENQKALARFDSFLRTATGERAARIRALRQKILADTAPKPAGG